MMRRACSSLLVSRHSRAVRRRWLSSNAPVVSNNNNNHALVDLSASARIEGQESQVAIVTLSPGQTLRAESGSMLYMTQGVEMETSANVSSGMKRFMTGQNIFVTDFTYSGDKSGEVALGTDFPSKILRLHLPDFEQSKLICQKGAYLASDASIDVDMAYAKNLTSGFFGGEGFVLQSLEGPGDVLIKAGGTLVRRDLEEGEVLRVSSGCLVAMTATVDYDVQMMPGFKNVMFGGEGLFVTTLKGPGTIWLQGMPPDRMISEIARRVPSGMGFGVPIGMGMGGGGDGGGAEGDATEAEGGAEDMVAATDAAVEGDRNATVASSGLSGQDSAAVDPESPEGLFGDAAAEGESVTNDPWNQPEPTFEEKPKFDEGFGEESFSTEDTSFSDDAFQDDGTTFSDFDESAAGEAAESATESAGGVMQALWDFLTGDD